VSGGDLAGGRGDQALPVEQLVAALRAHADVMGNRPEELEAGMAVIDRVRSAAREYVAAVTEHSGWGNPFVDLEDEDVVLDEEDVDLEETDPAGSDLPGTDLPGTDLPGTDLAGGDVAGGDVAGPAPGSVEAVEAVEVVDIFDGDAGDVEAGGPLRLTLLARWDFVVHDPAALRGYAAERLREAWPGSDAAEVAEQTEDPGGALGELFDLDCWDVEGYRAHGLEFAGGGWRTGPTRDALFDLAPGGSGDD
jgi:hypothetical protein